MNTASRPFKVLGIQQIAIGGVDKADAGIASAMVVLEG